MRHAPACVCHYQLGKKAKDEQLALIPAGQVILAAARVSLAGEHTRQQLHLSGT